MLLWILLATFCGCSSATSIDQEDEIAESDETFVLGDLLTPFDPPSLEQLEQTVAVGGGWVERKPKSPSWRRWTRRLRCGITQKRKIQRY